MCGRTAALGFGACCAMMLATVWGCVPRRGPEGVARGSSQTLTVFAAASLTEPLDSIAEAFEGSHPNTRVRASYAGTQELRLQVEQGGACDVFVSASQAHMNALVKGGHVLEPRVFAYNGLCAITDPGSETVSGLADLSRDAVRIVVATETCPAGAYTRQCWAKMQQEEAFGEEYVAELKMNVVSEETDVKLVLSKVVIGEADAGFV